MNDHITTQICEKNMSGEFVTELSMPDYEPEIRRLLRVNVTLTPPMGFADASRVGMNGEIIYDVLYMGNDGELYSTKARRDYELAEAFKLSEKYTLVSSVICETVPESVVSRAAAPRKISLRCKLRGTAKVFGDTEITEHSTYIENPDSIERLNEEQEYAYVFPSTLCQIELSDDFPAVIPAGQSGDVRIISHTASAVCDSVEAGNDEAYIKGTLYLSILASVDDTEAEPFKISQEIKFEEAVSISELTPLCRCTALICCTDCNFTVEDNRIFCEPVLTAKIEAEEDRRFEYTKDIYSTEVLSECMLKRYEFPTMGKSFSGNITVTANESLKDTYSMTDFKTVDGVASAVIKNVEPNEGKTRLLGELCLNILILHENEYVTKELKVPFKYEVETDTSAPLFTDLTVIPMPPRVKNDGERVISDCELQVMGKVCSKAQFDAVNEVVFGESISRENAVTVCFPSPTDSVWDVAKRYHIPTASLSSQESNIEKGEAVIF